MIKKEKHDNYKGLMKDGTARIKTIQQELDEISKQLKIPCKTFTKFIKDSASASNSDMNNSVSSPRKNKEMDDPGTPKFKLDGKSNTDFILDITEDQDGVRQLDGSITPTNPNNKLSAKSADY